MIKLAYSWYLSEAAISISEHGSNFLLREPISPFSKVSYNQLILQKHRRKSSES